MNSITTIKYTSKELAELLELEAKDIHNIAIIENIGIRNKGKFYFINEMFYVIEQNEFNNIKFKKYYWNEYALNWFRRYLKNNWI